MEYGGIHRKSFHLPDPVGSFNVVYSENESLKCFLQGYTNKEKKTVVSPVARYGSPVFPKMEKNFGEFWQLICYDISDDPNTVVLLSSYGVLRILPLDENGEGVLLLTPEEAYTHILEVTMIDSPYKRLWCKVGEQYQRRDIIGYGGVKAIHWAKTNGAISCTTKPLPVMEKGTQRSSAYNPNDPNFLAMDDHFSKMIEAEKNKAAARKLDSSKTTAPQPVVSQLRVDDADSSISYK